MEKIEYKRLPYMYQGRKIYEWEQSLEEVHCYIEPPPGVTAKMIDCKIEAAHITLGLKGNPAFMNEDFEQKVNASESYWTVEDGVIHLILTKGSKGVTWPCFLRGHAPVDPFTQQECRSRSCSSASRRRTRASTSRAPRSTGRCPTPRISWAASDTTAPTTEDWHRN